MGVASCYAWGGGRGGGGGGGGGGGWLKKHTHNTYVMSATNAASKRSFSAL